MIDHHATCRADFTSKLREARRYWRGAMCGGLTLGLTVGWLLALIAVR